MTSRRLLDASAGLGLRRALLQALRDAPPGAFDFLECAPDNWIGVGGRLGDALTELASRHCLTCHGLSLSLGGVDPLDVDLLRRTRIFLERYDVALYSEHLSYCSADGHLYDLMPIPFSEEAVQHVAKRIARAQDALGRRIAIENVSYYAAPWQAMSEAEFVNAVLAHADCDLLLDVNNVMVNATNHGYDAADYIRRMPSARIVSYHIAGHRDAATDLKIDTHGAAVSNDVWQLLAFAYDIHGVKPTLLERDFDFPSLDALLGEVERIKHTQRSALHSDHANTDA